MKKLFIEKDEEIASIVDRVISTDDSELVLVVPKDSALKESSNNFLILKREANTAGKTLLIESVDPEVLALGAKAKIEGFHPLFRDSRARSLSDIVPQDGEAEAAESPLPRPKGVKKVNPRTLKVTDDTPESDAMPNLQTNAPAGLSMPNSEPRLPRDSVNLSSSRPRRSFMPGRRGIFIFVIFLLLVGGGVWATNHFFGHANVDITFKTSAWQDTANFVASKSVSKISTTNVLPAEFLSQTKNTTQFFPASGKAVVSLKSTGKLIIYNAYSSQPQGLVATTRFMTPDGKVFRLDQSVTVPGAAITDGKIIPSSIEADVTADKPGEEYNIGPIDKLTIPGFKGSPKFDGFYGQLKDKTTGGAVGERPVPTDADITAAKEKTSAVLKSNLQSNLLNNRPEDFKIIDGASDFTITRISVNKATDDKGQFSVSGEAQFRAVAFREGDLKTALLTLASKGRTDLQFRTIVLEYKNPKVDFAKGDLGFTVTGQGVLWPAFNPEEFKKQIIGKDISAARTLILGLPDLGEAKISLWPIWLGTVPGVQDRVKITVH